MKQRVTKIDESEERLLQEKIPDLDIRRAVLEQSKNKIRIIVQPKLKPLKIVLGDKTIQGRRYTIPRHVERQSNATLRQTSQIIKRYRTFLEDKVGETPKWIQSARVFLVSANGAQIREIAKDESTKKIEANIHLK